MSDRCPECTWCALSPEDHGECDCPPHECQTARTLAEDVAAGLHDQPHP